MNVTANILEISMSSKEPAKELFNLARQFVEKHEGLHFQRDPKFLHDIDVALTSIFIDCISDENKINDFMYAMLSLIDSKIGDSMEQGELKRYYYKWKHFHDLCNKAVYKLNTKNEVIEFEIWPEIPDYKGK